MDAYDTPQAEHHERCAMQCATNARHLMRDTAHRSRFAIMCRRAHQVTGRDAPIYWGDAVDGDLTERQLDAWSGPHA